MCNGHHDRITQTTIRQYSTTVLFTLSVFVWLGLHVLEYKHRWGAVELLLLKVIVVIVRMNLYDVLSCE